MTPVDGFGVDPAAVAAAAMELVGIAERAHRDAAVFSGVADAMGDQGLGFDAIRAAVRCESSWQRAVLTQAAKLAVDGDTLDLTAVGYLVVEAGNTATVGGR